MRVVQLGSGYSSAQTTLLLMRFGVKVVQIGVAGPPDNRPSAQLLGECLAFGKDILEIEVGALSASDLELILDRADVVVDDRPLSYWRKRGVDIRALYLSRPPRASWCGVTPYGLFGIGEDWAGCELTEQASGPMLQRLGEPERPPVPVKGPQAAIAGAWHAALVIAASQFSRGAEGRLLDISLQECQYMHSELGPANWHFNGVDISRSGLAARVSVFPVSDGVVHMLFHDREWQRVARMIGRDDLAHDERFMTRYQRAKHLDEVDSLLIPWFMERTRAEAVEAGQAVGMPIAFDQTPAEIFADPQLLFRGAFETVETSRGRMSFPVGTGPQSGYDVPRRRSSSGRRSRSLSDLLPADDTAGKAWADGGDPILPLKGIRVLDLTNTWAGPRGATLLGDLGAEVIKVEGIEWMDMLRGFTDPPTPHDAYPRRTPGDKPWDRYLMWLGLARNKLNLVAELTRPEGREILDRLIAECDVIVTNMSTSTRDKYNLHYPVVEKINPRVIFATLSAYGAEGPRSEWRLFGDGQAAVAGLFSGSGYLDRDSITFGAYGDPTNGVSLAFQIVEALLLRQKTGRGTWVDVSCVETCLTYNARSLVEHQIGEDAAATAGYDAGDRWPHGVYRCVGIDRWIALSCGSDDERKALAGYLATTGVELPASISDGTANAGDWHALLEKVVGSREAEPFEHALRNRGIACQKVMRSRDVDGDAILGSRGFISWLWREDLGTYPLYSPFWTINSRRPPISIAPARFGEHNEYVLGQILGMSAEEIQSLRQKNVVGNTPMKGAELGIRPAAQS